MPEMTSSSLPIPSRQRPHRSTCRRWLSTAALGASLLVVTARGALAQTTPLTSDPRYDVITNDGSRYEGQLVERVAGDHVTIKLVTGDVRAFPLADVKADGPIGEPSAGLMGGMPQLVVGGVIAGIPLGYHGPDEVHVHITNADNEGGRLLHESASGWETVCALPCTTTIDPKGSYKIPHSDPFQFPTGAKSLDLIADLGSRRTHVGWGVGLIVTGVVAGSTFIPLLFAGVMDGSAGSDGGVSAASTTAGWIVVGVASAMIVAGTVLLALPTTSTLTTTDGKRVAKQPSIPLVGGVTLTPSGFAF